MTLEEQRLHGEVVSVREYFERVITDLDKRLTEAQAAAREAITKAEEAQNRRLELLNEFRGQAADRDKTFATLTALENTNENLERIRQELFSIRADHVQRREFDEVKGAISEGSGRRTAFAAAAAIIITLISISLGLMYKNMVGVAEVRAQTDPLQAQITALVRQQDAQDSRIDNLQSQIKALQALEVQELSKRK